MSKIDDVLVFLSDGVWHDLFEITYAMQIDNQKLEKIVRLLTEFNFIQISEHKVRVTFDTKKFLESISRDFEQKEKVS